MKKDFDNWQEVYELLKYWYIKGEYREIRNFALHHSILKKEWLAEEAIFVILPDIVNMYMHSVGWNYQNSNFIDHIQFDPYMELSPKVVMDCYHLDRILHQKEWEITIQKFIFAYMRGGYSFLDGEIDLCKQFGLELPYSTLDMWSSDSEMSLRVPRNYSLFFRGDLYNYYDIKNGTVLKIYEQYDNDSARLVKDKYDRYWYCVEFHDFDDRIERNFEWVANEKESDEKYEKMSSLDRYLACNPHFFSSENYDFILHDNIPLSYCYEEFKFNIFKMNGDIPPQLSYRKRE